MGLHLFGNVFEWGARMAISKSLSEEAINEFASRVSSDQEIPANLKQQLTALIGQGKWNRDVNVSDALEAFHTNPEGEPNHKTQAT